MSLNSGKKDDQIHHNLVWNVVMQNLKPYVGTSMNAHTDKVFLIDYHR